MCPLNCLFPSGSQIKFLYSSCNSKGKSNNGKQKQCSGSAEKSIKKETGMRTIRMKRRKITNLRKTYEIQYLTSTLTLLLGAFNSRYRKPGPVLLLDIISKCLCILE
jgi:hypothetical protein